MERRQCTSRHPESRVQCQRSIEQIGRRYQAHDGRHRAEVGKPDPVTHLGEIVEW